MEMLGSDGSDGKGKWSAMVRACVKEGWWECFEKSFGVWSKGKEEASTCNQRRRGRCKWRRSVGLEKDAMNRARWRVGVGEIVVSLHYPSSGEVIKKQICKYVRLWSFNLVQICILNFCLWEQYLNTQPSLQELSRLGYDWSILSLRHLSNIMNISGDQFTSSLILKIWRNTAGSHC